ncbi:DUF1294 domain-containing protein [Marinomonas sp.]|nr:DUF1294 domain-containing protein [Marinomonas sp.]
MNQLEGIRKARILNDCLVKKAKLIVIYYLFIYLASLNLVTFIFYGLDKWLAIKQWRRISELSLHFLSLCGGWVGAFYAQKVFRHKTIKTRFRVFFWITVAANVIFTCAMTALVF